MIQHKGEWTAEQLNLHKKAADLLVQIKDEAFAYIFANPSVNEYEVQQFILAKFKENNLIVDKDPPIVAFGESAALPHYFPVQKTAKQLKPDILIMIDIWAKINQKDTPFADITWMGCSGVISEKVQYIYSVVAEARDETLRFLEAQLTGGKVPTGQAVDAVCRDAIGRAGYAAAFSHGTGHSIGLTSPHGIWGNIRRSNTEPLLKNLGYTLEPGIYLKDKFGVRSEINFYINDDDKLMITTPVQDMIVTP